MPFFPCLFSLCSLAFYHWMFDEATVVEKNRNRVVAWTELALKSLLCVFMSLYFCVMLSRLAILFSCVVPSQPTRTQSRSGRPRCSSSSWTVCGKSCVSSLALSNSTNNSLLCSLNMLMLRSSGLSWETTKTKGW